MQVAKWGNSLAVRLPAALVQELGLKPGDQVELVACRKTEGGAWLELGRKPSRQDLVERLRAFRGRWPAGQRFDREQANVRR